MTNTYERFLAYDQELQKGSPLARLIGLKKDGKISLDDYKVIKGLIESGDYKKR